MRIEDWSLPEEYEYVTSLTAKENELAYIDTGFGQGVDVRLFELEAKFATWGGATNVSGAVFGVRDTAGKNQFALFASGATPNQLSFRYGDRQTQYNGYERTKVYTLTTSTPANGKTIYLDGIARATVAAAAPTLHGSVYLYGCNDTLANALSNSNGVRVLYYCKFIYDNTVVRDFIPVRRKLDGKLGMFDKITNLFYTSPNGVEFS